VSNELPELSRFLTSWGKTVVREARDNAPRASGKLANSLKVRLLEDNNNYTIQFEMLYYGDFQDKGVSGTGGKFKDKSKGGTSKYAGKSFSGIQRYKDEYFVERISPYEFKSKPPSKAFNKWVIRKGLKGVRNPRTGRFTPRKSLMFAVAHTIGIKGLKSSSWFSEPLGENLKTLPVDFAMKFELSLVEMMNKIEK